jgi:hypothetical protein
MRSTSSFFFKKATCFSLWDNSHEFKCTNWLGSWQRTLQCLENPTSCPTSTFAIGWPWEDVMGLSLHHFPMHKLSNPLHPLFHINCAQCVH